MTAEDYEAKKAALLTEYHMYPPADRIHVFIAAADEKVSALLSKLSDCIALSDVRKRRLDAAEARIAGLEERIEKLQDQSLDEFLITKREGSND